MPFQKGRAKTGGKVKGTLNYETLTKLERKAEFDKEAAKRFLEWIAKCRPEYGLDQFLGKVKDEVEVTLKKKPTDETQDKINKALKKLYG